ncbi:serine/threonine protein kinase [Williamsia sp. MIQD14]|uniref:serine/threonine protein kinase n=1 Tax=Williamsia sp. MIQD14 TaxID=3425703 RepID=UPI003DA1667D
MTDDVPEPPRRPNPSRGALVLVAILAVAFVIGLAAVIGYVVLGRSSTSGTFPTGAPATSVTTTAVSDGSSQTTSPATSSSPSASSPSRSPRSSSSPSRAPVATAAGAPQGSTPCPIRHPRTGLYRASSVGSAATSCGFAEEVRIAYARSGRPGQLPRAVAATSPETGETIEMMCAAEGPTVTCTGGDDAVVYLY